ncbi:hypothetical protein CSC94_19615 [Zhengella mangrovi]|uniref:TonB C-terminal domain-containing protein n=1 Tax=Zhengella mangrovi TaxID=1982044 RepID=A0A2G1QII4_9HYPH|nr:TonB family protein [Zhengella mangrovi]PHP65336.1 hypothetical protein CSC94_19615 [Zhengella mangrovi]
MKLLRAVIAILLSLGLHAALAAVVARGMDGGGDSSEPGDMSVTVTLIEAAGSDETEADPEMASLPDGEQSAPETEDRAATTDAAAAEVETPVETARPDAAEITLPQPVPDLPTAPPVVDLAPVDIAAALPALAMPQTAPQVPPPPAEEAWSELPQTVAVLPSPRPEIAKAAPEQGAGKVLRRVGPKPSREPARPRKGKPSRKAGTDGGSKGAATASQRSQRGKQAGPSRAGLRSAMASYGARVNSHVARRKPRSADGRGTVSLNLRIARSGALLGASISSSSGNAALDRKALETARRAAPYPPPPDDLPGKSLALRIRLSFR